MKILFLHPNFPGQFKYIARAASKHHDTKFLCQTHYGRVINGVERLTLKGKLGNEHLDELKIWGLQRNQELAKQYRKAFLSLKEQRWTPDLVISHSGWGCGSYVKEIWPKTRLISYLEWWFAPNSSFFTYDESNEELGINSGSIHKQWSRNQTIALELSCSDKIVSPTLWQREQLPGILRDNCQVIFDGVDTDIFKKKTTKEPSNTKIVTYGTRGMDPMRAFPQFIRGLPHLIKSDPNIRIEVAGFNETFYSPTKKIDDKSWGEWATNYLKRNHVNDKVKWMGHLKGQQYVDWLQNSDCHIYLTHPFIASWSYVEAIACNIPIVASDVEPVREFWKPNNGIELVDHRVDNFLTVTTLKQLSDAHGMENRAVEGVLDIRTSLKAWSDVAHIDLHTID